MVQFPPPLPGVTEAKGPSKELSTHPHCSQAAHLSPLLQSLKSAGPSRGLSHTSTYGNQRAIIIVTLFQEGVSSTEQWESVLNLCWGQWKLNIHHLPIRCSITEGHIVKGNKWDPESPKVISKMYKICENTSLVPHQETGKSKI